MLNQLLKFTLVSSALLWLRPRWRGLLALITLVVLVHVLHGEYLGYVALSGNGSLLIWSYVLKWGVLILAVLAYLFFSLPTGAARRSSVSAAPRQREPAQRQAPADDGFDFLRRKQRLQNRADKIITGSGGGHKPS